MTKKLITAGLAVGAIAAAGCGSAVQTAPDYTAKAQQQFSNRMHLTAAAVAQQKGARIDVTETTCSRKGKTETYACHANVSVIQGIASAQAVYDGTAVCTTSGACTTRLQGYRVLGIQ